MPTSNSSTLAKIQQHIAAVEQKIKKLKAAVRAASDAQNIASLRAKIKR